MAEQRLGAAERLSLARFIAARTRPCGELCLGVQRVRVLGKQKEGITGVRRIVEAKDRADVLGAAIGDRESGPGQPQWRRPHLRGARDNRLRPCQVSGCQLEPAAARLELRQDCERLAAGDAGGQRVCCV